MKKILQIFTAFTFVFMMSLFWGCSNDNSTGPEDMTDYSFLGIAHISNDYSSGMFAVYDIENDTLFDSLITGLSGDIAVTSYDKSFYILDKTNAKIIKYTDTVDYEISTGSQSNPYTIAFKSPTKAYLIRYGKNHIYIFNPSTGDVTDSISLADYVAYAGTDSAASTCEMSDAVISGNNLYVCCQRLKLWSPADTSKVVIIDTETDQITGDINLNTKNPQEMVVFNSSLYVLSSGLFSDEADGGLDEINLNDNTNNGQILDEADVDGNFSHLRAVSSKLYIAISASDWTKKVYPFDPSDNSAGSKLSFISNVGGAAYYNNMLYVSERTAGSDGIVKVNTQNDSQSGNIIETSMQPASLSILNYQE